MTGRNSGIRSIGDRTQSPANATATLARFGTRGSARSLLAVVTQSGRKLANSFSEPSGSLDASRTSSAHEARTMPPPTSATRITIRP